MREKLDELARLQEAAMAEQTTIAICAYRRALLRDGDSLLEYVRELEGERDQIRAEVDRLREIGPRCEVGPHELMSCGRGHEVALYRLKDGCLACKLTARAESAERERDEASQLLRDLAEILNPHDPYDAAKLLGWARDTVERSREADEALAPEVTDAK